MHSFHNLVAMVAIVLALLSPAVTAGQQDQTTYRDANTGPRIASGRAAAPGRIVVSLRNGSTLAAKTLGDGGRALRGRWPGVTVASKLAGSTTYLLHTPADQDVGQMAKTIAADANVAYAEPDYLVRAMVTPNDEFYNRLYALPRIGAEQAWDLTTGNPNILVAVIDTGVYAGHPDLGGNVVGGIDLVNGDDDASDDEGHGTHTAGIIAAVGNNGRGVAGVCWQCRILPIKALDVEGAGSAFDVARAVRYAADRGAKVINLSLGGENDARVLHDAIIYATNRDVLVVVAAGNEATEGNPVEYPAAYPEVLAVGATDAADAHAFFSNYGAYVDIVAPGVDIGSTLWLPDEDEAYGPATGTSEAAPFVAGLAGLIWSANPALKNADVRRILLETVDDLGPPGRDDLFGAGRINAARAVAAALPAPPPAPAPAPPPAPAPVTPPPPAADGIFFPETGHTLRGEFRRYWEANGGLPVFGYPTSDEQTEQTAEGSFVVQYFERNRFEFHPENPAPYNVLLGRLGDTLLRRSGVDWSTLTKSSPAAGCQFFAETGRSICEPFLSYWRGRGLNDPRLSGYERSLGLFGLPLTEPRLEQNSSGDTVLTQWFERARFEDHGSEPGRPGVLLGLLANELRAVPAPAPAPAPTPASPCPELPPSRNGEIRPSPCLPIGAQMAIDVRGFAPDEEVAFWLTAPNNQVFGAEQSVFAASDGMVRDYRFTADTLSPGRWYWVFQGKTSGAQAVLFFHIYQP